MESEWLALEAAFALVCRPRDGRCALWVGVMGRGRRCGVVLPDAVRA